MTASVKRHGSYNTIHVDSMMWQHLLNKPTMKTSDGNTGIDMMGIISQRLPDRVTDIKTIDSGFSKNSEAQKMPRPSPHMHDKYLIYFE